MTTTSELLSKTQDERERARAISSDEVLGRFEGGWTRASQPPDTDRIVQVMWADGSSGPNALCFYDSQAVMPPVERKYWWTYPRMELLPEGAVLAWREAQTKH
jgi:hypothetical protein